MNWQDKTNEEVLRSAFSHLGENPEIEVWVTVYHMQRLMLPPDEALVATVNKVIEALVMFLDEERKEMIRRAAIRRVLAEVKEDILDIFNNGDSEWCYDYREEILEIIRRKQEAHQDAS